MITRVSQNLRKYQTFYRIIKSLECRVTWLFKFSQADYVDRSRSRLVIYYVEWKHRMLFHETLLYSLCCYMMRATYMKILCTIGLAVVVTEKKNIVDRSPKKICDIIFPLYNLQVWLVTKDQTFLMKSSKNFLQVNDEISIPHQIL